MFRVGVETRTRGRVWLPILLDLLLLCRRLRLYSSFWKHLSPLNEYTDGCRATHTHTHRYNYLLHSDTHTHTLSQLCLSGGVL